MASGSLCPASPEKEHPRPRPRRQPSTPLDLAPAGVAPFPQDGPPPRPLERGGGPRTPPASRHHRPDRVNMTGMAPVSDAPTTEAGYAAGVVPSWITTPGSAPAYTIDSGEVAPELIFPGSIGVYDRMRRSDGQIGSTLRAMVMPILATSWRLVGKDVRPEVMDAARAEFGLDDDTTGRARRRRQGITFREHLRDALTMLPLGFAPFEQVYEVGPPSAALVAAHPETKAREFAHVRKLAYRAPRSLLEVRVDADGGLAGIVQAPPMGDTTHPAGVPIPADRLVMYVNDKEGADWTGTSVLRTAYKHWLIKDSLIRLGAQIAERNGMGVPVVTYPKQGGSKATALAIASAFRAGATAGVALEEGYSLNLVGVTGSTVDPLPQIAYHDQAASRALLAMFLDLGHDNGARSLGDTFVDYFVMSLGATTANVEDTFTEHVLRDWVALNYGEDEPYPVLKADELSANSAPTAVALKTLTDAGLITPDGKLEAEVRRRHGLPEVDKASRPAPVAPPAPAFPPAAAAPADPAQLPAPDQGQPAAPARPVPVAAHNRNGVPVPPHARALPGQTHASAAEDPMLDRLEALTARYAALRAGHPTA